MTQEEIRFQIKKLQVWYENKLAVAKDSDEKVEYSDKLKVIDEILDIIE